MLNWKALIKMLFDMLKKFFGWCDESSRKRQASELDYDDYDYISPKKPRNSHTKMNNHRDVIEIEDDDDDDDDIKICENDTFESFQSISNTSNTSKSFLRNRHPCYTPHTTKNHTSTKKNRSTLNSFTRKTHLNSRPPAHRYTALSVSHQLQEREEYSRLLDNFLPKIQIIPSTPDTRRGRCTKPIEIIDIENYEPSTSKFNPILAPKLNTWFTPQTLKSAPKNRSIEVIKLDESDESSPSTSSVTKKLISSSEKIKRLGNRELIATNSLRDRLSNEPVMKKDYIPRITERYNERVEKKSNEAKELEKLKHCLAKHNRLQREAALEEQLTRSMRLYEAVLEEQDEEEEEALPELTEDMMVEVQRALVPRPPDEVLAEGFGLRITRKDISTLSGLNWLNDEVINFYMNLLIQRGKEDKYPNVYAMNTFFYPKLLSGGHAMLKRWTRKVDIFAQDIVVVPVHLRLHWCMSIIDFRDKSIRYYDSMGGENSKCLLALRKYLQDESLDKKKESFDTSDWTLECMSDIPQQMNGSDCGVFSCTFAEYICANRGITFSQEDMPYFRHKMVYEILNSKLL